jgi:preprotein translocase subunit SecE
VAKKDTITPNNKNTKDNEQNFSAMNFVNDTKEELAKVVWPSRQQLFSESAAVILMSILVATIISLVDKLFVWGAGKVF